MSLSLSFIRTVSLILSSYLTYYLFINNASPSFITLLFIIVHYFINYYIITIILSLFVFITLHFHIIHFFIGMVLLAFAIIHWSFRPLFINRHPLVILSSATLAFVGFVIVLIQRFINSHCHYLQSGLVIGLQWLLIHTVWLNHH